MTGDAEDQATSASRPSCDEVRVAASAQIDDEDPGLAEAAVTTHVATCRACADHVAAVTRVDRDLRIHSSPVVPDLAERIMAAVADDRTRSRLRHRRFVVALTGVAMVVAAVVAMVTAGTVHAGREVAVFEAATGVALVAVAWRPRRLAGGVFWVVATLSLLVVGTALVDLVAGLTTPLAEVVHLAPMVATALLWPWVTADADRWTGHVGSTDAGRVAASS